MYVFGYFFFFINQWTKLPAVYLIHISPTPIKKPIMGFDAQQRWQFNLIDFAQVCKGSASEGVEVWFCKPSRLSTAPFEFLLDNHNARL